MAISVTTDEVKTNFPELFQKVLNGEEIIIADEGSEVARVIPTLSTPRKDNQPWLPDTSLKPFSLQGFALQESNAAS